MTASGFPGESAGVLSELLRAGRPTGIASLSRGYGLSVTPLQLAQAYATIGALGVTRPVSMLRVDTTVAGERVLSEQNARTLIILLEIGGVRRHRHARRRFPGYRVAGKTGTARKAKTGGAATTRIATSPCSAAWRRPAIRGWPRWW